MQSIYLCPDCDLPIQEATLRCGRACCPRCCKVFNFRRGSLRGARALILAALIFYIPANVLPIITVTLCGDNLSFILIHSVTFVWGGGMYLVATLVFLFALLMPLLSMITMAIILLPPAMLGRYGIRMMRAYHFLRHWSMLDICLIGILVAIIKLKDFSTIYLQPGLLLIFALILLQVCATQYLPMARLWRCYSRYHRDHVPRLNMLSKGHGVME